MRHQTTIEKNLLDISKKLDRLIELTEQQVQLQLSIAIQNAEPENTGIYKEVLRDADHDVLFLK